MLVSGRVYEKNWERSVPPGQREGGQFHWRSNSIHRNPDEKSGAFRLKTNYLGETVDGKNPALRMYEKGG